MHLLLPCHNARTVIPHLDRTVESYILDVLALPETDNQLRMHLEQADATFVVDHVVISQLNWTVFQASVA